MTSESVAVLNGIDQALQESAKERLHSHQMVTSTMISAIAERCGAYVRNAEEETRRITLQKRGG
jgi:GTP cyclohydrolase II